MQHSWHCHVELDESDLKPLCIKHYVVFFTETLILICIIDLQN